LKKLNEAVDRFAYRHPRFGIPNLMKYIVAGNVVVYLLLRFSNWSAISFLEFTWSGLLRGELWRLITFIFVPNASSVLSLVLFLYFYYFIGNILEREWGTAKFTLYYISGVVLTLLTGIIASLVTGSSFGIAGANYVNLSMFFAFAALYPDMQVLLLFIIPIKMKWLALADAALFAVDVFSAIFHMNLLGALLPIIALLNFLVYFWTDITHLVARQRGYSAHRYSHQTIQFRSAARKQEKKAREQGYHHKCEVCGRTDADYPDLQFRYCSRCAGYHCFCEDHIFNHEHFKE